MDDKYINITYPIINPYPTLYRDTCTVIKITNDIEKIIYDMCMEYGLVMGDNVSTRIGRNFIDVTFSISLEDDADTIGSCIERIKNEIKMYIALLHY